MKLLIFGDVYGRVGRKALKEELPGLKQKYSPDFTIANIENCTSGRGPIEKHAIELEELGLDIMTSGDHVFDNYVKIKDYLDKPDSKLLRGANYYKKDLAGKGYKVFEKNGKKLLMIHLIGDVFMSHNAYNPFLRAEEILQEYTDEKLDGIVVDFHAEATAESVGMGYFLDGKVSVVYGTHTHIQTNDDLVLAKGTGYITDVGMNGPLYSVIGADFESVRSRFLDGISKGKIEQSLDSNYLVSGLYVELDEDMMCKKIEKIKIKGNLK